MTTPDQLRTDAGLHRLYPIGAQDLAIDVDRDGTLHQVVLIVDGIEIDITHAARDLPCVMELLRESAAAEEVA